MFERLEKAGLGVLDRRADDQDDRVRRSPRSPTDAWQTIDYPEDGEAQIAETDLRRAAVDRPAHPPARAPSRAVARLAALRLHHQPRRGARARRGRAPRPRRRRTGHRRSQRPGACAFSLRRVPRQRRLDRARPRSRTTSCAGRSCSGCPDTTVRAARTLRRWLLSIPGRLTRHARGWTLHLPARWPWHGDYISALNRIRALPPPDRNQRTSDDQPCLRSTRPRSPLPTNTPKHFRASAHRPTRPQIRRHMTHHPTLNTASRRSRHPTRPIGGSGLSLRRGFSCPT